MQDITQGMGLRIGGILFAVMVAFAVGTLAEDETTGLILTVVIGGIGGAFFFWLADRRSKQDAESE